MTLRDHYTKEQRQAAQILDKVRAKIPVPAVDVRWALIVLGEPACG